jgi:signal transduction histidine kinase
MKRRQNILRIAFAALLVLLFAASFVITYTSLELSNRPIEVPTAVTEETTSVEEIPTSADEG